MQGNDQENKRLGKIGENSMKTDSGALAIKNGMLIDGTGADPSDNSVIVVEDSKIVAVGQARDINIPKNARIIDASGKTVMPGLIDAHMHFSGFRSDNYTEETIVTPHGLKLLRASRDAEALLRAGYTTAKDCSSMNGVALKRAIAEGTIPGPRVLAAGFALSQTFGHGDTHFLPIEMADIRTSGGKGPEPVLLCDGVEECIKGARYALREGADFIKVCTTGGMLSEKDKPEHTQYTVEEIKAVVDVARAAGTFVTAHCQGTSGMHNSIDGGIKTIDHAIYPDEEAIEKAKKKGVVFVTTLSIMKSINEGGVEAGYPIWAVDKSRKAWSSVVKNMAKLREGGATVASGTDFLGSKMTKMGTNALELELLAKYSGFSPMEAIVTATLNGAKACALEANIGSIEEGKLADIIIVDGNPLKNIKIFQDIERIRTVIKQGKIEVNRNP